VSKGGGASPEKAEIGALEHGSRWGFDVEADGVDVEVGEPGKGARLGTRRRQTSSSPGVALGCSASCAGKLRRKGRR